MCEFLARWLKPKEAAVSAQILNKLNTIMSQLDQIESRLIAVEATLTKAADEITTEITALRDALANVDLSPEAVAALEKLEATAKSLDDIIPDASPAEDPAPVEEPTPEA